MKKLIKTDFLNKRIDQKEFTEETEPIFANEEGYKFDIILDVIRIHTEQEISSAGQYTGVKTTEKFQKE